MTNFESYCARQRATHGDAFVAPTDQRWIDAYNKGPNFRVKVDLHFGGAKWGFVALTTGWKPSFMLMHHLGQHGSSDLLDKRDVILDSHWIGFRIARGKGN